MKSLIVNADDFGMTAGVNAGIIQAFREGIVTSTTLMANGDAFDDAVERAMQLPGLDVGCHLVLIGGRAVAPPAKIPTLAAKNGNLPQSLFDLMGRVSAGLIRRQDIEMEFTAQIERIRAAGLRPSHLDTHKHTHVHPKIMDAFFETASSLGIERVRKPYERPAKTGKNGASAPAGDKKQRLLASLSGVSAPIFRRGLKAHELKAPDHFFGIAITGLMDAATLQKVIEQLPDGASELMCHPGTSDSALEATGTRLTKSREVELGALIDPNVRASIREHCVHLMPYRELN